jgi:subtilase family serine protease
MTWEGLRLGPNGVLSVFILAWTEANVRKRFSRSVCGCVRASQEGWLPRASGAIRQGMNNLRRAVAPVLTMILVLPLIAAAQGSALPARVTDRVNLSQLTTLKGNTHALAQARYDQGAAPPDLPMNRMLLVLQRSVDQESALQNLLIQQQVTGSASFRKWLTPDQFGQQFGIADSDIQAVTSWLSSYGFQSIQVAKGRNIIEFSGTAGQIEAGFHTSIHQYLVNGELHYANSSDPQIPSALAPVIAGVVSMHNFRPKPTIHQSDKKLSAKVTPGAKPQIDLCTVGTSPCPAADLLHALVPGDFNTIYNIAPTMTGAGFTIGIISNTNINVNDVANFRSLWGLPTNTPNVVLNGPDPGDVPGSAAEGEAVLDATWSGAVAPLATVDLVASEDTNAAQGTDLSELYIVDNNLADVMTESFEACEEEFAAAGELSGAA